MKLFSHILLLSTAYHSFGQVLQPQPLPCLILNQPEVDIVYTNGGISHPDCIETTGNLTFDPTVNYSIKAGESITFSNNTHITPDNAHQFHAYIEQSGFDVAWYGPSQSGTVGQFEKLELGIQLESTINNEILNFVNDQAGNKLNPFNPKDLDVYAEFYPYQNGSYQTPQRINGFFYKEFDRDTNVWIEAPTQHNFRLRFAPTQIGAYKCVVTAVVKGHGTFQADPFYFGCTASSNKGFVKVGANKRYLKIGNDPFYPVGMNIFSHKKYINAGDSAQVLPTDKYDPVSYDLYYGDLTELADNGANYFRHIVSPQANEIEFEVLNNYTDRLDQAWEFDKLLDTAKTLDLKIHYNMHLHDAFEVPGVYFNNPWDWPKFGDPLVECSFPADSGYCYRRLTGSTNPSTFLTDPEAIKFYKYRLRYMIARWGYSTDIAVMELMSEANNIGAKYEFNLVTDTLHDQNGNDSAYVNNCIRTYPDPVGYGKQYGLEPDLIQKVQNWQIAMLSYMKDSLQHHNHPFAVDYTGTPDNSDHTFESPYVDIAAFNNYGEEVNKFVNNRSIIEGGYNHPFNPNYLNKPMMHSEYGPGATGFCDGYTSFIKALMLTPFTGVTGAFNWDFEFNEDGVWQYIQPIRDFMEGIPLDAENWRAKEPIVTSNKAVEVLYLQSPLHGGTVPNAKIVGAISNRTYNYYTQGDTTPCTLLNNELNSNHIYQSPTDFFYSQLGEPLLIPNMVSLGNGYNSTYIIEWYLALDGVLFDVDTVSVDNAGNLELNYPTPLTGNDLIPILFFAAYPTGSSVKSSQTNQSSNQAENSEIITKSISEVEENRIKVFPNPATNIVYIENYLASDEPINLELLDVNGKVVYKNSYRSTNFQLDISVYERGIYYLSIQNGSEYQNLIKLVKL